jgi:hypothetical protein
MNTAAKSETGQEVVAANATPLPPAPLSESAAIISMIERMAGDATIDIARLEKILELRERVETRNAQIAFAAAVANAKAEIKPITRNATGHNAKKYADFSAIAREVDPILSRHGLSYRFRSKQAEKITVTCILSHCDGHSEETELSASADVTGNKNAIQAIGSTLTYLQRYSLVLSLGLASSEDDDGRAAGSGETITDEQAIALGDLMESVGANPALFLKYYAIESVNDLPLSKLAAATAKLESKRAK